MNIVKLQDALRETVKQTATETFGVNLENLVTEIPPKTELGDLAFPVAFELAKLIKQQSGEKQNPRAIAEQLKAALEKNESVERVEIAGPGYLNVFYNRALFSLEISNRILCRNSKIQIMKTRRKFVSSILRLIRINPRISVTFATR